MICDFYDEAIEVFLKRIARCSFLDDKTKTPLRPFGNGGVEIFGVLSDRALNAVSPERLVGSNEKKHTHTHKAHSERLPKVKILKKTAMLPRFLTFGEFPLLFNLT